MGNGLSLNYSVDPYTRDDDCYITWTKKVFGIHRVYACEDFHTQVQAFLAIPVAR